MRNRSWMVGSAVLAAGIVAAPAFPQSARASCAAPPPAVIWSYPAAGEVDVPLDADLLLVTNGDWTNAVVLLDERELTAEDGVPGRYDLGSLPPRVEHTVTVKGLTDASGKGELEDVSWTFTTGDAESEPASSALRVESSSSRLEWPQTSASATCRDALFANSCFDTGQPYHDTFEVETEAEVALAASSTGRRAPLR